MANLLPTVLASYSALPDSESAGVVTTMDLRDYPAQIELQNILAGESKSLWLDPPNGPIRVAHITAHYGEAEDEKTGEMQPRKIITLSGLDGTYHTCSEWAYRDLQRAVLLTGWRPGDAPLKLEARRTPCSNGHTRQSLALVR